MSPRGSTPRSTLTTLKRARHLRLGDRDHTVRGDHGLDPEFGRETLDRALGVLASQDDLPAERRAVLEVAEVEVGVGDRDLVATQAVARGPGSRSRRARAYPQGTAVSTQAIDPPPALTVWTSTIGCLIGMPPTMELVVV